MNIHHFNTLYSVSKITNIWYIHQIILQNQYNFNNISHTFDDVNTFTSTIKFDSNFIYSLAISTNSSLWIHKLTITSYR